MVRKFWYVGTILVQYSREKGNSRNWHSARAEQCQKSTQEEFLKNAEETKSTEMHNQAVFFSCPPDDFRYCSTKLGFLSCHNNLRSRSYFTHFLFPILVLFGTMKGTHKPTWYFQRDGSLEKTLTLHNIKINRESSSKANLVQGEK